jgi:hypothetical protein
MLPLIDQLSLFIIAKDWPRDSFIAFSKYLVSWPMARYLHNPLPKRPMGFPSNNLVFKGVIRRILKNRLVSFNKSNTRLWSGYLQGVKRGCARVSEDFVLESMIKHKQALSAKPDVEIQDMAPYFTYFNRFFRDFTDVRPRLLEASPSASVQQVRGAGGAREYIRRVLQPELSIPSLLGMVEIAPGKTKEVFGPHLPTLNEARRFAMFGTNEVRVSAVCEPLKVRLITKGDSFRYWFSKFYQKDLWSYLQKFPQFSLTRGPLGVDDLESLLHRERELFLDFPDWVSGDYSAATDGLNLWYTKAAFEESLSCTSLKELDKDILRSVLYEQKISYPDGMVKKSKGRLSPFLQSNGQLMGSTLSFPILCIINLVCYWKALEFYIGCSVPVESLPVLVNGDDILFRANKQLYDLWLTEISKVGFTLSLGKNYVHPTFLTVNSQIFHYSKFGGFKRLGYLNTGLLTGQSKLTGRDAATKAPVWALYNEVIPSAVDPLRAHRRFIHYNRSLIEEATNKEFNIFLPVSRGGLGFIRMPSQSNKITSFQQRWASFLEKEVRQAISKNELPRSFGLGLIQERAPFTEPLNLTYKPHLSLEPIFGPYNLGIVPFLKKEYIYPSLSQPFEFDEKLIFRFRIPSKRRMAEFRSQTLDRVSHRKLYVPLPRICSRRQFTTEALALTGKLL